MDENPQQPQAQIPLPTQGPGITISDFQPPTEKPKKCFKLVLTILVGLIVIGAGLFVVGLHLLTIKPKPSAATNSTTKKASSDKDNATGINTSGWQTISNPTYHFSYKYPSDDGLHFWHVSSQDSFSFDGEAGSAVTMGGPGSVSQNSIGAFGVSIYPPGSDPDQSYLSTLTPEYIKGEQAEYPTLTITPETITKNSVAGSCSVRYDPQAEFNSPVGVKTTSCRFIYHGSVYLLSAGDYLLQTDADKFGKIDGQPFSAVSQTMLDSFMFTK